MYNIYSFSVDPQNHPRLCAWLDRLKSARGQLTAVLITVLEQHLERAPGAQRFAGEPPDRLAAISTQLDRIEARLAAGIAVTSPPVAPPAAPAGILPDDILANLDALAGL